MVFEFTLDEDRFLPTYYWKFGNNVKKWGYMCIDTGAGISAMYMSEKLLKALYPDYEKTDRIITVNDVNGVSTVYGVYKIPEFVISDDNNNSIHIKNFHFILADARKKGIDILLSGGVFYNTKFVITPRIDKDGKVSRMCMIETKDERVTLVVEERTKDGNVWGYPGLSLDISGDIQENG